MLSGENGILSRATETKFQNDYFAAEERARLAYMTVKTEIMAKRASNGTYDAREDGTNLANKVAADLTGTGWGTVTYDTTDKAIKVTYTNASIKANGISEGKPANNGHVDFAIILSEKDATLSIDGVVVGNASSDSGTGGSGSGGSGGSGNQTGGLTGVDFGEKTASTIEAGEDLTIGTESFRVLSKSASEIIAVPFYNITLVTPEENSGAYPEQTDGDTGNTTAFSSTNYWTTGTDTIAMTDSRNYIQKYITAYSTKLSNATNGKVTARVARYSEMSASGVTGAIRNPGQKRFFWLGSGGPGIASNVRHGNGTRRPQQPRLYQHVWCSPCNSNQPIINQKEAKPLARSQFLEKTAPATFILSEQWDTKK